MKNLFVLVLSCLTLLATPLAAQEGSVSVKVNGEILKLKPPTMEQTATLSEFAEFKKVVLGEKPDETPMFFCLEDYCGCIGDYDCEMLSRSGMCQPKYIPGAWKCKTGGTLLCSCLPRNPGGIRDDPVSDEPLDWVFE